MNRNPYRPVRVGQAAKVTETWTGRTIIVQGEAWEVSGQEYNAMHCAARAKRQTIDQFIGGITAHCSRAGAESALRNAILKFLPPDHAWLVVSRVRQTHG